MNGLTRRCFLALLAAAGRRVSGQSAPSAVPSGAVSYRVDATILLLSVPIYSRKAVGTGYACHTVAQTQECATHRFEFAAGSLPERARGLNRAGMIRETVLESLAGVAEANYFGFMTASKEESLAEAKKALNDAASSSVYVAIQGQSRRSGVSSRRASFVADLDWKNWRKLQERAELACRDEMQPVSEERLDGGGDVPPNTFLYSLYRAMRSANRTERQTFVYSRDRYELATERRPDPRTGGRLAARGLDVRAASVCRLSGVIRNRRTGHNTPFRIWTQDGSDVPLRIEYQPRGFLQLALEVEPDPSKRSSPSSDE